MATEVLALIVGCSILNHFNHWTFRDPSLNRRFSDGVWFFVHRLRSFYLQKGFKQWQFPANEPKQRALWIIILNVLFDRLI